LLKKWPDLKIHVKVSPGHFTFAQSFLQEHLGAALKVSKFDSSFSIAFNQQAMAIDREATKNNMKKWLNNIDDKASEEKKSVMGIYNLIISDIVPEAFEVAEKLSIPSIALGNFTWYEILKEFFSENELASLLSMYEKADVMIEYNLSTEDAIPIKNKIPVGLTMRCVNIEKSDAIRKKYKKEGRPLLFASFGGDLRLDNITLPDTADYLYTFNLPNAGSNFHFIETNTWDTQNYLNAADGVVSKCGWSTLAESIICKKPLFIFRSSNGGWVEEKYMLEKLISLNIAYITTPSDFFSLNAAQLEMRLAEMNVGYQNLPERYFDDTENIIRIIEGYF